VPIFYIPFPESQHPVLLLFLRKICKGIARLLSYIIILENTVFWLQFKNVVWVPI